MTKKKLLFLGIGIVLILILLGAAIFLWGHFQNLPEEEVGFYGGENSGGEATVLIDPDAPLPEDTKTVGYEYGGYGLSLSLPDGWAYEVVEYCEGKSDYGVCIFPEGSSQGISVLYYTAFGVCGTGLTQQKSTLAGYEVSVGTYTYDDTSLWDFIVVKNIDAEGDFVIIRFDDLPWWDEKGDEAMAILNSLKISYPARTAQN